jgi:hypothetical protein
MEKKKKEDEKENDIPSEGLLGKIPTANTANFAPSQTAPSIVDPLDLPLPPPIPDTIPRLPIPPRKFDCSFELSLDSFDSIRCIKTIGEVPESACDIAAQALDGAIKNLLVDPKNPERWSPTLLFMKTVLVCDKERTGAGKKERNASAVVARAYRFMNGEIDGLLEKNMEMWEEKNHPREAKSNTPENQKKRWVNLARHGREGLVLREMNKEEKAPINDATARELKSKFPEGQSLSEDPDFDDDQFEPMTFSPEDVLKAAAELRHRSAGTDGVSGTVILQLLRSSSTLLDSYTQLVNLVAAGRVPQRVLEAVPGLGLALKKKPSGVRPIVVPLFLDGMVTKCASLKKRKVFQEKVQEICPSQQAMAPRGAEVAAHSVRDYVSEHSYAGSNKAIALIDLTNCFNLLNRHKFVPLFKTHFPFMYRYVYSRYRGARPVSFSGIFIWALIGLLQGCGFGPLLCALCLASLFMAFDEIIRRKDPQAMSVSLMDDLTGCADIDVLVEATEQFAKDGPAFGGFVNYPKTEFLILDPIAKIPEKRVAGTAWAHLKEKGMKVLGTPIGTETYEGKFVVDRFNRNCLSVFPLITSLNHPHVAWRLFKRLNVQSGIVHILRTTPPESLLSSFPEIESKIRKFLGEAVFCCVLTDKEWAIVQLPFDLGGWNVTPLEILSPCAYLASLLANKDAILSLRPGAAERHDAKIQAITALIKKICPNAKLPELKPTTKQRELVRACMEARAADLLANADERTRALLRGQQQKHASLWKHATSSPDTFFPKDISRIMNQYSIAHPLIPQGELQRCPSCEKVLLDPFGDHALICMPDGDVVHRHNDLYQPLIADARSGMISLSVETTIMKTENSTYRGDFLFSRGIPGYCDNPTVFDMVITNPMNKTTVRRAARNGLATAQQASRRKDREQADDLRDLNYDFMPLPFETTGGHTPEVAILVHYIAQQKEIMTGIPFGENAKRLWERLSVILQRANAFAIKRRHVQLLSSKKDDALSETP